MFRMTSLLIVGLVLLSGCATTQPRLKTVEKVDINRFMGPWYVIAHIPTFIETKAYNGIETYTLLADGSIDTVFTFNNGAFDGPAKRYNPRGFVYDKENNSTWGMQFIWPFKSQFLITYLNDDYTETIISRDSRDYVWIMARTPILTDEDYNKLVDIVKEQGYNLSKLRKVPQQKP